MVNTFEENWECCGILVTAEAVNGIGFPSWMETDCELEGAEALTLPDQAAD